MAIHVEYDRRFAFGDNRVDDCECPAVAAGFSPERDSHLLNFIAHYDAIAQFNAKKPSTGTLSEHNSKACWLHTIRELEKSRYLIDLQAADAGRAVAIELGWL